MNPLVILMGVSGCGKTTIGKKLAEELEVNFFDADDFHPETNIQKMSNGFPLNDDDRLPWLQTLNKLLRNKQSNGAVLACSALKESYRKILNKELDIEWIYLKADFELIKQRMANRSDHFMPIELLQSQFDALEEPSYGIQVDVSLSPKEIINTLKQNLTTMNQSSFGVYGLGVMGKSLALNILDKGFTLSVFNIETDNEQGVVSGFLNSAKNKNLQGFTDIEAFVNSIETPRKILLMVKAGHVVDIVVEQLSSYLDHGDIIIDGGNSHYLDTKRRTDNLIAKGIHFVGMGVSGGEEGALKGPSLMPGGNHEAYLHIAPILEAISARDKADDSCCTYIGADGAGHFVKMVHNGIEYGEMQLLAEMYCLLSEQMTYHEIASLFETWNQGELSSYLLGITSKILRTREGEGYLLDKILDKAGNKGTGAWSSVSALETGVPTTVKTAAVFARYISSFKKDRVDLSNQINIEGTEKKNIDANMLKKAYDFARTINMHQGLELIRQTSEDNNWNINLAEVLRIWTNGCIIKSEKLNLWQASIEKSNSLLLDNSIVQSLAENENSVKEILNASLENRIAMPCFWASHNYWVGMTTKNSSANMIQAQRDFFGAHTYQRKDRDESQFFHTNWLASISD